LGDDSLVRMAGVCALACASFAALAQPQLACGRDGTGRSWCVDRAAVSDGPEGLRFAPLYLGNDRVAHYTGHVARANCQMRAIEFLAAGKPFWSARFDQSMMADRLGAAMCE
jgi:hypothetical protein